MRHFGSKVGLYLASLAAEHDGTPTDLLPTGRMLGMLEHVDNARPGPIFQADLQSQPTKQYER